MGCRVSRGGVCGGYILPPWSTSAVGTHSTGMHSCSQRLHTLILLTLFRIRITAVEIPMDTMTRSMLR